VSVFEYEIVTHNRAGRERVHRYTSDTPLHAGDLVRLAGRYWLLERVEPGGVRDRVIAGPARYRLTLVHADGNEEQGAFRRYRPDAPRLGHSFSTIEGGQPASWHVVDERLAYDGHGEPYLELRAERDYGEVEGLPDHELEHSLSATARDSESGARELLARAGRAGLSVELVALDRGSRPDWEEAERYLGALTIDEIEDDLLEMCGVDPDRDSPQTWLATVKRRLRDDLERFRTDVEGDRDEIEVWDFLDGSVFAAVGSADDESDADAGYGWLCRLVDSGILTAAGFHRVRKAELLLSE
jgi:hypothetical protein